MIARAEFALSAPLAASVLPNDLSAPAEDLDQPRQWRRFTVWVAAALIMTLGAGVYLLWSRQHDAPASSYVTKVVTRGNLSLSVTANGTLQPTRTVNIGSELSGTVTRVLVDVNDRVKKDQLLVELDTARLRDQVERSRATLASSVAKVAQAVATVKESQAQLGRLQEVSRLSGGKVPSKSEIDSGQATFERAQADEAAARAAVNDAKAALSTDETTLAKASIRSPTDGVVLTRAVDPGNAVASSLQAVTLFTVAEDLTKMKLQINVDEADVGLISAGQTATFSVSAYPSRKYPAKITRVAYGSTISENVVTYIAYLAVANSDLSLRPGMTATATIDATERRDVLLVPNAALRFTPSMANAAAPGGGPPRGGGLMDSLLPRPPATGAAARAPTVATSSAAARHVWILRDGQPMQIAVEPSLSDGKMTEIESTGHELQPGMQVIVDQRSAANS
jgi:HlyD family secretion protein